MAPALIAALRHAADPRFRPKSSIEVGYLAAIGLVALSTLVRVALGDLLLGFPFLTFFVAIFLASYLFGWRSGVLAAVLGGLIAAFFFIRPDQSFAISTSGWIAVGLYTFTATLFIFVNAAMHDAFAQLEASETARRRLTDSLEQRVVERTIELENANRKLVEEAQLRVGAEAQVRQMQKIEAVGQLTGGIAHDFNNLLAVIMGAMNLARRRLLKGDTNVLEFVDAAFDGAGRAATLTSRLMAFSRQQPLAPAKLDVGRLVSGMSELVQRTLGETIKVETVLSGGLWKAHVDPGQLESAILNLCVNARDAMSDGGKLTIETANCDLDDRYARLHGASAGQYVLVAVTDTGTGMPRDVMEKAFDPFFTTKSVGKGTGLGLSQVHGFVKQSGGHIKIYSEVGHGTTVKIYLPRSYGSSGDTDIEPTTRGRRARRDASQGQAPACVVLLVEDDDRVRETSAALLTELGCRVLAANGAKPALKLLEAHPEVSLLFTDIVMPETNGRVLADLVAKRRPDLPVLFTTGFTRNAIVHHGVLDPGVNFIAKPFTLAELGAKISEILELATPAKVGS